MFYLSDEKIRKQLGYSLIELLISLVLIGLLSTFSVQGFRAWQERSFLKADCQSIVSVLELARAESFLNQKVVVQFSPHELKVFVDQNGLRAVKIVLFKTLDLGFKINQFNNPRAASEGKIIFDPLGTYHSAYDEFKNLTLKIFVATRLVKTIKFNTAGDATVL